jgi:hypothetical protein
LPKARKNPPKNDQKRTFSYQLSSWSKAFSKKTAEVGQNNASPLTSNRPIVPCQEPFCIQNDNQHQPEK